MLNVTLASDNFLSSPADVKRDVFKGLDEQKIIKQEDLVLLEIYRLGKTTSSELMLGLRISSSSLSRSLYNLRRKGWIDFVGVTTSTVTHKQNSIYQVSHLGKIRVRKTATTILNSEGYYETN